MQLATVHRKLVIEVVGSHRSSRPDDIHEIFRSAVLLSSCYSNCCVADLHDQARQTVDHKSHHLVPHSLNMIGKQILEMLTATSHPFEVLPTIA
jgi:hypothetical protein